ncbi:hypothetical protein [Deinococcus altitudinis]|uniref:hypothetical protein n=1 Tax=Deinococcus altitudinis TaxID=468914 RepID=UPI0038920C1E
MVWDVLGVTGWTVAQVMALTFPQLEFIQKGRGRMLYTRLEPQISANLANLSAKPGPKGEPSDAQKIITRYQQDKAGVIVAQTSEERTLARAKRILLAPYLGDPDKAQQIPGAKPKVFPGMGRDEAQAWVAWVKGGHCPDKVWLEIQDVYEGMYGAAQQEVKHD